jgi:hypothetical protein
MKAVLLNQKSIVMKKLQTIFAAAALLLATSSFASNGPEKVSAIVKNAFQQNFNTAQSVRWELTDDFYFAYFKLNGNDVSVAYNEKGELVATSRVIAADQLPLSVTVEISKKYGGYNAAGRATEITYDGQTSYYIVVENNKQSLKLKCLPNGDISVDSKSKK